MKKILHFEDDVSIAHSYGKEIIGHGYDYLHFKQIPATKAKFIDLIVSVSPDLIIIDTLVPAVGALDVVQCLKNNDGTRSIPILSLSSVSQGRAVDRLKSYDTGKYVMRNTILPTQIVQIINSLLHDLTDDEPIYCYFSEKIRV